MNGKKHLLILVILSLFSIATAFCQLPIKYLANVQEADSLYILQQYQRSAIKYNTAFQANNGFGLIEHRYNAAKAWTQAGYPDSAFSHLDRIAMAGRSSDLGKYTDIQYISSDSTLKGLQKLPQWSSLLNKIKENNRYRESKLDRHLIAVLDTISFNDLKYRFVLDSTIKVFGPNSAEAIDLVRRMNLSDSLNAVKVSNILDKYGWLSEQAIGQQGNRTLFLVIQHADLKTQEKYLPLLEEAVKNGNAQPSQLALLTDRVAIKKGRKQIYGSQIGQDPQTQKFYLLPLDDPANVDKLRQKVGLPPLAEYLSKWNIVLEE